MWEHLEYLMGKKHARNAWASTRKTFHVIEA